MKIRGKVLVVVFFCCQSLVAQTYIRVGPSVLFNYNFFDELVYSNIGGEVSAEFSLSRKFTMNIPLMVHYGEHENIFDEAVTTKNTLIGISPEIRYHTRKRYNDVFYGIGGEIKHLNSMNFVPPDENNESYTLSNWEYNVVFSYGQNISLRKGLLTPIVYFGIGHGQENEYSYSARGGFTYGFKSKVKTKKRFNKSKSWQ
jgi:hypothetical protein